MEIAIEDLKGLFLGLSRQRNCLLGPFEMDQVPFAIAIKYSIYIL